MFLQPFAGLKADLQTHIPRVGAGCRGLPPSWLDEKGIAMVIAPAFHYLKRPDRDHGPALMRRARAGPSGRQSVRNSRERHLFL
ncbi:Glycerophosphoryl diester phosphodiesterase [hydrothermal vent metagenome]|uniref:Glycerophosphoryl diester phosphodiesterase n=1 Tax=hydrothermal vent metagenome TaxID=652676 RepID=A0A3B0R6I2_9ZZZZ